MHRPAIVVILLAAATAAAAAAADPVCLDIAWNTLARSGLPYGSGVWGAATAKDGKKVLEVVPSTSAIPSIATSELSFNPIGAVPATWAAPTGFKATALNSVSPDFISFHTKNGKTFAFNHFEYPQPSKMYVSELSKPDAKGKITVVNTKPLDDTKDDGLIFMCSGTMTPWGSHLGGEEYAPDCRLYEQTFAKCVTPSEATQCGMAAGDSLSTLNLVEFARYYGLYSAVAKYNLASVDILNNQAAHDKFVELYKCYNYGSSPEAKLVSSTGTTSLTKWRTLGRMSHETALVMPDRKTVYSTDDHPNGVWLKFVADKKQKLDSGSLYAAKLKSQRVENGKPTWDLEWILLGKGNQAALETIAESNMKFSDIFEVATPTGSPPACPTGFTAVNTAINFARVTVNGTNYFIECLKVKSGMETAAAFFESRRYAFMLGATTEFEKQEGIAVSQRHNKLWFTTSAIRNGMTNAPSHNFLRNDIDLPQNLCGGVMEVDLDKTWSGTKTRMLLTGDTTANTNANNSCNLNNIAEPDNLYYVAGNLLIQEDTGRHENNVLWAYNVDSGSLTRVLSSPRLAEVSGLWSNVIKNFGYLTMAFQHPEEDLPSTTAAAVESQRGYMGYLGPIPNKYLNDKYTLTFNPIPAAVTPAEKSAVVASAKVCIAKATKLTKNRRHH